MSATHTKTTDWHSIDQHSAPMQQVSARSHLVSFLRASQNGADLRKRSQEQCTRLTCFVLSSFSRSKISNKTSFIWVVGRTHCRCGKQNPPQSIHSVAYKPLFRGSWLCHSSEWNWIVIIAFHCILEAVYFNSADSDSYHLLLHARCSSSVSGDPSRRANSMRAFVKLK